MLLDGRLKLLNGGPFDKIAVWMFLNGHHGLQLELLGRLSSESEIYSTEMLLGRLNVASIVAGLLLLAAENLASAVMLMMMAQNTTVAKFGPPCCRNYYALLLVGGCILLL
ncbi:hypothetical protein ACLOJK_036517 [Asimina triloba]